MAATILDLEPKRVWYYFNEICKIPHGSGNEAGLRNYMAGVAKSFGCEYLIDKKGNLIIRKPAQGSKCTNGIILQGHMDMVCEAEKGKKYDPLKDPIVPRVDGEWLKAAGTSLGADNAIALASALAIIESKDLTHGPIECLFTVEEETGLFGASALESGHLKGKTLINMDSEVENTIYVGCAGAEIAIFKLPVKRTTLQKDTVGLQISVSELLGGHSGLEIHRQRGNAIKLLGRILAEVADKYGATLSSFEGGTKHNVIPSNATATVAIKKGNRDEIVKLVSSFEPIFKNELSKSDPNCKVGSKDIQIDNIIEPAISEKIIGFINAGAHGVLQMSLDIEGLVQTSTNFAKVNTSENDCSLEVSVRSSIESEKRAFIQPYYVLAKMTGAKLADKIEYPGWQPNLKSPVLGVFKKLYKDIYKSEPIVTAIHAGLECGVITAKYPGLDMVAYGPDLHDVHSPNEKLNIQSAQRFYKFITTALETLAKE